MRHSTPEDNVPGLVKVGNPIKSFDLENGTLFVLHPDDEETLSESVSMNTVLPFGSIFRLAFLAIRVV